MKNVRFDVPGVLAIGPYLPGRDYHVDDTEAERLVSTKGFHETTEPPPDEPAASDSSETDDGR